jgi:TRAP-type C4-dicarboxylate transport system permease small subunit
MDTPKKTFDFFGRVHKLAELAAAVAFILLCLSVTVQVVARYIFDHAYGWGEELPIILFLWVSFLAAAVAYRDGNHLGVDFIVAKFSRKWRLIIYYVGLVLCLGFILAVGYYEGLMTLSARQSTFVVMKFSKAWCYVGIPVACLLFALFIIERLLTTKPRLPEDEDRHAPG